MAEYVGTHEEYTAYMTRLKQAINDAGGSDVMAVLGDEYGKEFAFLTNSSLSFCHMGIDRITPEIEEACDPDFSAWDQSFKNLLDKWFAEPKFLPVSPFNTAAIDTSTVFSGAEHGEFWVAMSEAENQLARWLADYPEGTGLVKDGRIWFLDINDETNGKRVLFSGSYDNGEISEVSSRFEFDLMFVDVSEDDLRTYIESISAPAADFQVVTFDRSDLKDGPSLPKP